MNTMKAQIQKIISGGQTGVDRAALDIAIANGMESGGWCPAGRRAEDGAIPATYPLHETSSKNYAVRTRWNVRDSEGTLILNLSELDGGSLKTKVFADNIHKPCMLVQLDRQDHPGTEEVVAWLRDHAIRVLNVAGPRESKRPGIYAQSYAFLKELLMGGDMIHGPVGASFDYQGEFELLGREFFRCYFGNAPDVSLRELSKILGVGGTLKWAQHMKKLMMLGLIPSVTKRGSYRVTPLTLVAWFEYESDRRLKK